MLTDSQMEEKKDFLDSVLFRMSEDFRNVAEDYADYGSETFTNIETILAKLLDGICETIIIENAANRKWCEDQDRLQASK